MSPTGPEPAPKPESKAAARLRQSDSHAGGPTQGCVGVFDSGVGGLSVLREIMQQLPHQDVLYFADSAHVPYGERDIEEIRAFSQAIASFLVRQGASVVVVACHTASAAALHHVRARCDVPVVGMEPAVKPAVERTHSQHVGVIATRATFQGELFARLVERFGRDTTIHTKVCPGLVERVEAGQTDDPATEELLREYLTPMLKAGIDSLVLGCTHYPFLRPAIDRVLASAGCDVVVIDPAPAVARQTGCVLANLGKLHQTGTGTATFFTSGAPAAFEAKVHRLVCVSGPTHGVRWVKGEILLRDRDSQPLAWPPS